MAFDTIRNVLGQMAMQKATQRSPMGQAQLAGQQLRNQLAQQQLDQLMPLQVEQLKKQIDFMVSPQEAMTNEIAKETLRQQLRVQAEGLINAQIQDRMLRTGEQRGEYALKQAQLENAGRIAAAKIPRVSYNETPEKFPVGSLTGKYTPESIALYRQSFDAGAPNEGLLVPMPSAAQGIKPLTESQAPYARGMLYKSSNWQTLKDQVTDVLGEKGFFGKSSPFTSDDDLFLTLQTTDFPNGPKWRDLGTPAKLRKDYPEVMYTLDKIRGMGPTQASMEMSGMAGEPQIYQTQQGTWRLNPDGSYTKVQ
jgi:hypothetical protein